MLPLNALSVEFPDPLGLCLRDEHQKRYERIKAWRESQDNPHFTEVSPLWRDQFGNQGSGIED